MCEAQDFLKLVCEEVEDQIDFYRFSEDDLLARLPRKEWTRLYRKHKHLLYDNKRQLIQQVNQLTDKIKKIEKRMRGLQKQQKDDFPHVTVINKWLQDNLKEEWKNIPYKYRTKETMKPELLKFIESKIGTKVKSKSKLRLIDEMLDEFEIKCIEMHEKESERQQKRKRRMLLLKINTNQRTKLMKTLEFLSLKKKLVEQDRNMLIDDVRDFLTL